ncbi:MAG: DUF1461 domain-containing protein [Pseudomonadota bacterium]
MTEFLRSLFFALQVLIVSLALPLAATVLTPSWYLQNCEWHGRCAEITGDTAEQHIGNLRDYFLQRDDLRGFWSDKERRHLAEVRVIYQHITLVSALALVAVALCLYWQPNWVRKATVVAFVILVVLALGGLSAFGFFWRDVLHPLLFDNRDWLTNPRDMTWYITPRVFFRNSMIVIVSGAALIMGLVYALSWYRDRRA